MKHIWLYTILLLLFVQVGNCQPFNYYNQNNKPLTNNKKDNFHLSVNSSVVISSNKAYCFNESIAPSYSFKLSKKFTLITGIGTSLSQWYNIPVISSETNLNSADINTTSIYGFASGLYKLNSKLTFQSSVLFENIIAKSDNFYSNFDKNYKDLSFGINYNPTSHISFNAQLHFTDRPYSYYSGFYNSWNNPFYSNYPFH